MVKSKGSQTVLEFGNGDILISSGVQDGSGLVIFENHEPMPIGAPSDREMPCKVDVEGNKNIPVYMTFSKPESIDALIAELKNAKRQMMGEKWVENPE